MKTIYLLLAAVWCLGSFSANAQDYITVYKDCDFRGASHRLYEGDHPVNELGVGNDQISSIRIPRGMKVIVYQDNDFRGGSQAFQGDMRCLAGDWNDRISSIRVEREYRSNRPNYGSSNRNMVTLYIDSNYRGDNQQFGEGSYNVHDIGLPNDSVSSIKVPSGMSITVYTDDNHRGRSGTYSSDVRSLPSDLNDKITSFRVQRRR